MYPRDISQPMSEEKIMSAPLEPTNEGYALAKIAGAKSVESVAKQDSLDWKVLIPSNLYGVYESGDITNKHFLGALLEKIKTANENGSDHITVLGTGAPLRQFTYAKDVAKIIKLIVDNNISENMNVGTHENLSIKEMVDLSLTVTNSTHLKVEWDTTKEDGQYRKDVDCSKLYKNFPDFKFTNFIDGVRETYNQLK